MKNVVFFAFQGEKMCFFHILFNAIDMHKKGMNVKIVIEGKATALIPEMYQEHNPLFKETMELGLIDSVCRACSKQMGVLDFIEGETSLQLNGDLMGHPPIAPYVTQNYEIITL